MLGFCISVIGLQLPSRASLLASRLLGWDLYARDATECQKSLSEKWVNKDNVLPSDEAMWLQRFYRPEPATDASLD